jgi:hypothetical protein
LFNQTQLISYMLLKESWHLLTSITGISLSNSLSSEHSLRLNAVVDGQKIYFIFWRSCIQILVQRQLILNKVFLNFSRQMRGYNLKLGHDCFLPHPFQFIIQ